MIRVQRDDFDIGTELAHLSAGRRKVGGVASFVGLVREISDGKRLTAMTLEHYPGMTEKILEAIVLEAEQRWSLEDCLVVHRYGRLMPGDRIVLVGAAAEHRQAAIEACAFLIDWLKTEAPFWKQEETATGTAWVAARDTDRAAAGRWDSPPPPKAGRKAPLKRPAQKQKSEK